MKYIQNVTLEVYVYLTFLVKFIRKDGAMNDYFLKYCFHI